MDSEKFTMDDEFRKKYDFEKIEIKCPEFKMIIETSDGKKFDNEYDAIIHQKQLDYDMQTPILRKERRDWGIYTLIAGLVIGYILGVVATLI